MTEKLFALSLIIFIITPGLRLVSKLQAGLWCGKFTLICKYPR